MSLSRFAVDAPVKVTMIFIGVLLLGWISLSRLPTNLFPDIRAPKITVSVDTRGLSPQEVERRICEVLERNIYSIRGVRSVQSIARADQAVVVVEFDWETNLDFAILEVKKAGSDLQRDRNEDIESLTVVSYDPNAAPVVVVALQAPEFVDEEAVYRLADQTLKPRFERLEGVANVALSGGVLREVQVRLDESALLQYNMQVSDVVSALQSENVDGTGGWIEEGSRRFLLKAAGKIRDIDEIRQIVVKRDGDASIRLEDVGRVELLPREPKSIVRFNGKPAVGMAFYREADSNTVAVANLIQREIESLGTVLPEGWTMNLANDQSRFIRGAIREVRNNAILGGVLAILVLALFLRDFRTTLIISIAIPISIIATFNLMYFQGLSLNLMSLGGLALGCGMLVDNAIVVLENIFRLREEGTSAHEAAREGARQVGPALIASTLTTVSVFLPIVYVEGVAALLFREQALTVSFSLLGSLIAALLLIPMMSAYFLPQQAKKREIAREATLLDRLYRRSLQTAIALRWIVVPGAVGIFFLAYMGFQSIPQEFLPPSRTSQVGIRLVLPTGTPIEGTNTITERITTQLDRFGSNINAVYTRVGESEGIINADTEDPDGPNTALISVTLRTEGDKVEEQEAASVGAPITSFEFISEMKPILDLLEDAKVEFDTSEGSLMQLLGGSRAPLFIEISGSDIDTLASIAGSIQQRLSAIPELGNVRTNILDGAPEVRLTLDRQQLARLGLDINSVATILRDRIDGSTATQIQQSGGDVDVRVLLDEERIDVEALRRLTFRSSTGSIVNLGAIATWEITRAPREIVRQRQQRVAYVYADLADGVRLSQGIAAAEQALDQLVLPSRYALRFSGEEQQRRESFSSLAFALLLSVVLVYMVMASIFESFLQPFLIMFTIPLAGIGVVAGLLLTGQTINVMSIIGIVMLGGIVVNNAIVLLDRVNQLRHTPDANLGETLIEGCEQRLRPVLMTSLTTMLGLIPLAVMGGDGAELRRALAVTVLGGLLSSTLLTLYVIPCCQSFLDSLRSKFTRKAPSQP